MHCRPDKKLSRGLKGEAVWISLHTASLNCINYANHFNHLPSDLAYKVDKCVYSLWDCLPFIDNLLYYFRILEGRDVTQVCGILAGNFPQNSSHNFP